VSGLIVPYNGIVPTIAPTAFVAPGAVVAGDVVIGADSGVWFNCVLRGDTDVIRVGERTNIQDGTVVHTSSSGLGAIIGDDVTIGHLALIHACRLESGCFVGMGARVLDGAVVESGAMVAAGALVSPGKRVRSRELWAGIPAKPIRDVTDAEILWFRETVERYIRLAETYRTGRPTVGGEGLSATSTEKA